MLISLIMKAHYICMVLHTFENVYVVDSENLEGKETGNVST